MKAYYSKALTKLLRSFACMFHKSKILFRDLNVRVNKQNITKWRLMHFCWISDQISFLFRTQTATYSEVGTFDNWRSFLMINSNRCECIFPTTRQGNYRHGIFISLVSEKCFVRYHYDGAYCILQRREKFEHDICSISNGWRKTCSKLAV